MDKQMAEKAVKLITDAYNRGMDKDETIDGLISVGLCESDAQYLTDMVDLGYQRATSQFIGLQNFSSHSGILAV